MVEVLSSEAFLEFMFKHAPYEIPFILIWIGGYHYFSNKRNHNGHRTIEKELKCLRKKMDEMDKKYIEKVAVLETKINMNGGKK